MRKHTYKALALLLAGWLLASLAMPSAWAAPGETVAISSAEALMAFSRSCSLDGWSRGKTFVLTADLDLKGADFAPIPTFGGIFLGQGHTISGLRLTGAGSNQGLFRRLQSGAVVQDLNVSGAVAPEGSRSSVGGIAGVNSGTIRNCSFRGNIQGKSAVGGIAGVNGETGQIVGCAVFGFVDGESAAGGIVGRNLGILVKCENSAGVNLTGGGDLAGPGEPEAGDILGRSGAGSEVRRMLDGCSDVGGIAGYSGGMVQSCVNSGSVGYPHVGYNIGGIAGRQNGCLSGCVNSGTVRGRKDVGGIVGQAEPYLVVNPGRDVVAQLRTELNTLENLIDRTLDEMQSTGDDVSAGLSSMGNYAASAGDSAEEMLNRLREFTDGTVESVNTVLADVANALDQLAPALDDLSDAGRRLERLSRQLGKAMDDLDGAVDIGERMMREIRAALDSLQRAGNRLAGASDDLKSALEDLLRGMISGDGNAAAETAGEIETALDDLGGSFSEAAGAAGALRDALSQMENSPESGGILASLGDCEQALSGIAAAVDSFPALSGVKLDDVKSSGLDSILEKIQQAGRDLEEALSAIRKALERSDALSGKLGDGLEELRKAADSSAAIGRLLYQAFDAAAGAVKELTRDGPAEFVPLGEDFRQASGSLYDAMGGLFDEMEALNSVLQSGNNAVAGDLRAVSRQCNVVFDVLLDAVDEFLEDTEEGAGAWIRDASEEDIAAAREGKVSGCRNTGGVEGDRNVGGIAGSMAVEFDLDPEDDAAESLSFGADYEMKVILQDSLNRGAVTAKKDCAGGLVGRMDLGIALDCENYGAVSSTGGDYVGGAAGWADGSLRRCCFKGVLSGRNYVGGIAGRAGRLRDCCAIATIAEGAECLGAIAGGAETEEALTGNRFLDTGIAGVDGVSCTGRAEPAAYADLRSSPDIPAELTAFSLTLLADGRTVAQIPFSYGEDLSLLTLPEVPAREDSYGVWPAFDTSGQVSDITLEAVYAPWVTVVASVEREGKLPRVLAEGRFTGNAVLRAADSGQTPPEKGEDVRVWSVALTGTDLGDGDEVPLRLLHTGGGKAAVWQYREDGWERVEAVQNGRYLLLTMAGTEGIFCVKSAEAGLRSLVLAASAALLAAAALYSAGRKLRKSRRSARPAPAGAKDAKKTGQT